ncbi:MAG: hypothetical protein HEP71_04770 [Roseivirga sp.]|nr:hypothetical protein [Roseivirga sp.]
MKKYNSTACIWLLVFFLFITFTNCGGDDGSDEPTTQEIALELLSGNWALDNGGSVKLDGEEITANFSGFGVSFTDGAYSTTAGGDLFRASGTWQWVADSDRQILMDDGKEISITTLSETELVFSFQFAGSGGVVAGLAGNYTIALKK